MNAEQYGKIAGYQHFPTKRADAERMLAIIYPGRQIDGVPFAECSTLDVFTEALERYRQAKAYQKRLAQCERDYRIQLERMANTPRHKWRTKSISELEEELGLV